MKRAAHLVTPALLTLAGPALASGGGEEGGSSSLIFSVLNFALILGVIFYFARKPVAEYLEQRRQGIQRSLEDSAKLLADAEAKLQDWNDRTGRLDAELAGIRETSRRIAEEEREEILAQARANAERIQNDARVAIDQELLRARRTLAEEAGELAIDLAAKLIADQVTDDDQQRLFDEFLSKVEAGANGSESGR
jgi:F-type H+-transporting ATPase subunit b